MGACCDNFLQKEEIHTNESRLRLLEHKVTPLYSTINDPQFTYFLPLFQQHAYLERLLRSYKQNDQPQHPEDTNDMSVQGQKIAQQHRQIENYLKSYDDEGTPLRLRMLQDQRKIADTAKATRGVENEACMVKLQIQNIQVVKGIHSINIVQEIRGQSSRREEHLLINRARSQKIYRQFVFPSTISSKIKLITDPVASAMTIDVQDIAKAQVICEVFTFKANKEDFGFIALRLQYVSGNQEYRREKHERLVILQKQLRLCEMGREGMQRLSEYRSSRNENSVRNTILSEAVSEYPNQYEV